MPGNNKTETREIKALVALMKEQGLAELEIEDKRGRIRLVREAAAASAESAERARVPIAREKAGGAHDRQMTEHPAANFRLGPNQILVESHMVGVFYRASSPEAPPFVEEGDVVRKGQPLCIIEAMKMMNEIEAETAGRVVNILCTNGQPVEYGQPLMVLQEV